MPWLRSFTVVLALAIAAFCSTARAQDFTLHGCFLDDLASPALSNVAGAENYNLTSPLGAPQECFDECFKLGHEAFGIDQGAYCFCGNNTAVSALATAATCDATCGDGTACGGVLPGHFSLWLTASTVSSFNASFTGLTEPYFVQTTDEVTLSVVGITEYSVDWGDGAISGGAATTHTYTLPGSYVVLVWADLAPQITTVLEVTVIDVPDFLLECPAIYELNIAAPCNMSNFVQGFNFTFDFSITSPVETLTGTGTVPASVSRVYGTTVDQDGPATMGTSTPAGTSFIYNPVLSKVVADGFIVKVEAITSAASGDAVLEIMALTPACASGQFCRDGCGVDCVMECGAKSFCPITSACNSYCPIEDSSGYELVSLGTATVPATGGAEGSVLVDPPIEVKQGTFIGFKNTAGAEFVTQPDDVTGDLLVDEADTTAVTSSNVRHSVRLMVEQHTSVGIVPDFNCTKPSVVPVAEVPLPYDATTEIYANESAVNISITITSPAGLQKADFKTALCQVPVLPPTNELSAIIAYGSGSPLEITFTEGAPIVMYMTIDDTKYYSYHDDASVGGSHTWSQPLLYPMEGQYTLVGEAFNALSRVNFTSFIRVIPNITDLWTMTADCPCYDWENGYTLKLDWPSTEHPPWNATINITTDIILRNGSPLSEVVFPDFVEDFLTYDGTSSPGGASGAATALMWSDTVVSKAGNHSVTAVLVNEVSFTTVVTQYEVKEAIRNVSAIKTWVTPDGREMNGLGLNENVFIVNHRVLIYPTAITGQGEFWRLRIQETESEEIIEQIPYTTAYFNITFDKEGNYTLTVSGNNSVQGWVDSSPIHIVLVDRIANFRLEDDLTIAKPNIEKTVLGEYDILTPISCLIIDWGDGSPVESYGYPSRCDTTHPDALYKGTLLSAPVDLMHTYTKEGAYTINALAFDEFMNLPSSLDMVVADIDCIFPNVTIVDAVQYAEQSRKLYRMLAVREEGMGDVVCNETYTVQYEWKAMQVDSKSGVVLQSVPVKEVATTWNNSILFVPALSLEVGFYKLTFTLTIKTKFNLARTAKTYVEIIQSPLSPVIITGSISALARGYQQTLTLDPGNLSYDPDEPDVPMVNVTWQCRQLDPSLETFTVDAGNFPVEENLHTIPPRLEAVNMNGGGCFGKGKGTVDVGATKYIFDMATFSEVEGKFEMVAEIYKDIRRAKIELTIEVTPKPQPLVDITCATSSLCWPLDKGQLIKPTVRLGLNGVCTDACGDGELFYKWNVLDQDGNPIESNNTACTAPPPSEEEGVVMSMDGDTCEQGYTTTMYTSSLGMSPTLFALNPTVEKYKVRLVIITEDGRMGYSEITVLVNQPPIGGTCNMKLNNTYALISRYDISCNSWKDPEELGIGEYVYFYYEKKADGTKKKSILATTKRSKLSAILPVGNLDVYVSVCDVLDSCVDVFLNNVNAEMISKKQFDDSRAMTDELIKSYSDSGDQSMFAMVTKAYNSIIKNAGWLSLQPNDTANMTQAEIDDLILMLSNMSASQIEAMLQDGPATSLSEINMKMDSLNSALDIFMQSDEAHYGIDLSTRDNVMEVLRRMSSNIKDVEVSSPKELEPFLSSSLDTMTTLMTSANTILKNGDRAPPRDMLFAADMDYDTSIGDNLDLVVPTGTTDVLTNSVLQSSQRKFESQVTEMLDILQDISSEVQKKLVKGEFVSAKTDSGASMLITKVGEETLVNGLTIKSPEEQRAKTIFPKRFCPSKQFDPYSICRTEIGITVVVWPCITHYYSATATHLSYTSRIMQAQVSLENKLVEVAGQKNPIIFEIPREPETLPAPRFANTTANINSNIPLVYHYFNISMPMGAYTFEITPSEYDNRRILLVSHNRYPTPSNYLTVHNVSKLSLVNGSRVLFVNSEQNQNRTGKFVAGVGLLKIGASILNFTKDDLDETYDENYYFRIFISACYFFNETSALWSGASLGVVDAQYFLTKCSTPHLTGFGTGFLPTPNEVDFDFIIANMGFIDNSTLYAVLILLIVVYIVMMIWSHYKDKKDFERLGAIPFPDNNPADKYIYEITTYTGPDSEAPCESQISMILSGDYEETAVRQLPKPNLNLYRRYDVNTFVMTTAAPLGNLHYLRVFHDNSGRPPYDSWQLERVVIRDLQERKIYSFETHSWLSFSHGENGAIDRTFSCAENNFEGNSFSQEMYNRTNRGANQDHMWMSIFLRPIGSRFSRKERVTVCAVFLYLSMLLNALWYETSEESGVDSYIYIGPIPITTNLVLTGFLVLLVVFPVTLLFAMVFKRARPRKLKRCRALEAIEKQKLKQLMEMGRDENSASEKSKISIDDKNNEVRTKDVPIVKCIPWWTRVLAWILALGIIGVSVFLVWAYGIMWGNIKTIKWFASFFSSFAISLVVTQWIKVIFTACCSSVFSKTRMITEDIDCDEELPHLKQDESWKHMKELDSQFVRKVHKIKGVDVNEEEVAELRARLKKSREMKNVMRGIMVYCLFLVVLLVIVNDRADFNGYLMKEHLTNLFFQAHDDVIKQENIKSRDDVWHWLYEAVLPELRCQRFYNGKPPLQLKGFLNDQASRIIGYAILTQVRTRRFTCTVVHPMDDVVNDCSGTRGLDIEDHNNYCAGWRNKETFAGSCHIEEFYYRNSTQLQTFSEIGDLGTYGGGGYVLRLKGHIDDVTANLKRAQSLEWLDRRTRRMTVSFSVYNANVNLFATCLIAFEFIEGGGLIIKQRFEPVKLLNLGNSFQDKFVIFCQILFVLATVFFTLKELWQMKKQKCDYFASYWNLTEFTLLIFSYMEIFMHFYKSYLIQDVLEIFNRTYGNAYVRVDSAVLVDQYYIYTMGFIMFVCILKLIKLLQFNKRMDILALTISRCWDELSYFFIAFGVIFFAFCVLFFFMFLTQLPEFSYIGGSIQMCFSMMLGKFEFQAMKEANELSPILFFVFSVMNSMILINIMLTIILQAFTEIKLELLKKENKYDMLDFIWATFKKESRLQPNPVNQVLPSSEEKGPIGSEHGTKGAELPDKVNELMVYINDTYFDGKLDTKNSMAMKKALGQKKRTVFQPTQRTIFHCED
ncbi:PLAT/LH2 domain [Trinorchestia longiramus]|nr:PLAT/LH2 domain [Trinorchestia longiramus]